MYHEKRYKYHAQTTKPIFQADAALLIDIWGADIWKGPEQMDHTAGFSNDQWCDYMARFTKNCIHELQKFNFNVLLNATYKNSMSLAFNKDLEHAGLDQTAEFTPMHYAKYSCGPVKKFFLDCQLPDIYNCVKPKGKIIVGGGSWGACVHFRPVGMYRLIREGFRVFTTPNLCYNTPYHQATGQEMTGIHLQDLLWDDIVWTRCVDKGIYYDNLYEGIMVHPDDALGRKNGNGFENV